MEKETFRKFVWRLRKPYLWILLIAIPAQFIFFKWLYPCPNFRGDSAAYIGAALAHANATEWPVGYSKFLSFIHFFSHSDTVFAGIQYTLLEVSALFFIVTLKYFIDTGMIVFAILFIFIVFNPIFLHLGNYIMSDGLFISLSLLWMAQLIWIIYRPSAWQVLSHAILLACLFTVRYNALFYPLVSTLAFILSSLRPLQKVMGIVLSFILIGLFINYTENKFHELNGVRQFSPFGGWQLANNALYMYENIPLNDADSVPARFRELDDLVRQSFVIARKKHMILNPYIKDYYIWQSGSPLGQYLDRKWRSDTVKDMFIKWASMGPMYSAYGGYLVKKYPIEYFKYFVLPNIGNFFRPAIADLGYYNQGSDRIYDISGLWFGYKYARVTHRSSNYELSVIEPYPTIIEIFNVSFLLCSLYIYMLFYGYKNEKRAFNQLLIVAIAFWFLNFCFSSSASSVELRYQIFQFVLCFCFTMILLEKFFRIDKEKGGI